MRVVIAPDKEEIVEHLERVAAAAGRTKLFGGGPESDAGRRFAEAHGYAVASVGMTRRVDLGGVSAEAVQAAFDEAEQGGKGEDAVIAVAQGNAGKRLGAPLGDGARLRREPIERRIVKNDRHVAGGALHVHFDGQPLAHGGAHRRGRPGT